MQRPSRATGAKVLRSPLYAGEHHQDKGTEVAPNRSLSRCLYLSWQLATCSVPPSWLGQGSTERRPYRAASARAASGAPSSRSLISTAAPTAVRVIAVCRPIPESAPVTISRPLKARSVPDLTEKAPGVTRSCLAVLRCLKHHATRMCVVDSLPQPAYLDARRFETCP